MPPFLVSAENFAYKHSDKLNRSKAICLFFLIKSRQTIFKEDQTDHSPSADCNRPELESQKLSKMKRFIWTIIRIFNSDKKLKAALPWNDLQTLKGLFDCCVCMSQDNITAYQRRGGFDSELIFFTTSVPVQ